MTAKSGKSGINTGPAVAGALVAQPHGGAIKRGGNHGNAGGGRPRDEIRAKLRNIAWGKGLPFLRELFDGEVPVRFVGRCPNCKHECTDKDFDDRYWQHLQERVNASVEHRLKATDQTLRYGIGTQTEAVTPDDMQQAAKRIVNEVVTILLDEEHWELARVQAVAARITRAAQGTQSTEEG